MAYMSTGTGAPPPRTPKSGAQQAALAPQMREASKQRQQGQQAQQGQAQSPLPPIPPRAAGPVTGPIPLPAPPPSPPSPTPGMDPSVYRQSSPAMSTGAPTPGPAQAANGVTSYGLFSNAGAGLPGQGTFHPPPLQIMPGGSPPPTNPFNIGDIVNGSTGEAWYPDGTIPSDVPIQGGKIGQNQTARRGAKAQAAVGGDLVVEPEQAQQAQVGPQAQSKPGGKGNRGGPLDIDGDGEIAWWEEVASVHPVAGAIRAADWVGGRLVDNPADPDGDGFDADGRPVADDSLLNNIGADLGRGAGEFVGGFTDAFDDNSNRVAGAGERVDDVYDDMGQFQPDQLTDDVMANWSQAMNPAAYEQRARNLLDQRMESSTASLNEAERRLNSRTASSGLANDGGMRTGLYNDFASRNLQSERDVFNDTLDQQMSALTGATAAASGNRAMDQSLYTNEVDARNKAAMADLMKEMEDNPSGMAMLRDLFGAGGQAIGAVGDLFGSGASAAGSALSGGGLAALLGAAGL